MRNQKHNARLQQARGQLFICGMFGNCASSVLSPRTPPGIPPDLDAGVTDTAPPFVWNAAANDNFSCAALQQQQIITPELNILLRHNSGHNSNGEVPGSPSTSASDVGDNSSSTTDASSSELSISVTSASTDLEEHLAEIRAGNVTKMTISGLNNKLGKASNSGDNCQTQLLRSSGVAASLITFLLSSDLAVTDGAGARDSVDERHVPHVLEESLTALTALSDLDDAVVTEMASSEFLAVLMWYVRNGRKDARERACLLLEKLSLEESFKGIMGASAGVMDALNDMLRDEKHLKLVKLATRTLLALCLLRDNRRRAVEVGAVASLLEMLPRARSASAEKALATLELLGTIEEGKAAIIDHALAVPVLVELILKVSDRGTEYAAGTLSCMCSDSTAMREAAVAHGAPTKLLLLIQSDCTARAKRKASQLLKVLHKIWVQDPCNPDSEGTQAIHY